MRSGELAKFAGVTPRTLRHYRSIGLLPEPPRDKNDYCNYRIEDLLRLLRIKNLVSLGFSLDKIREPLDEENLSASSTTPDYLDALDSEIATEIERLNEQRRTIAVLRKAQVSPDTPVQLIDIIALMGNQGLPPQLVAQERDALLLVESSYDEIDFDFLSDFYQKIINHDLFDRYRELGLRTYELTEDATDEEIESLAQESADILTILVKDLDLSVGSSDTSEGDAILRMYEKEGLDSVQRRVFSRSLEIYSKNNPLNLLSE
ncbi:MAG: MerR family transcriptional regulator [Raoultibacter sp.]|jgi:DNA-binding transcriptional MerR regulator